MRGLIKMEHKKIEELKEDFEEWKIAGTEVASEQAKLTERLYKIADNMKRIENEIIRREEKQ